MLHTDTIDVSPHHSCFLSQYLFYKYLLINHYVHMSIVMGYEEGK